ncbi:hypothetical protein F7725_008245 [Dissostichus mawsoni]|uniref:Calponin-homology (CH) domain-containing protein n=1 Tax=Dissostichus mawsoni TaxID=36200 RepID=A0A7J5Y6M4_DISMA|nr:hypothetical protein F7725_008245 [Dissostichus mawsoni]
MENEDWIICETLHTVSDLDDFIELYNVEQEQIQKKTFTNWVNAQLAKLALAVAQIRLFRAVMLNCLQHILQVLLAPGCCHKVQQSGLARSAVSVLVEDGGVEVGSRVHKYSIEEQGSRQTDRQQQTPPHTPLPFTTGHTPTSPQSSRRTSTLLWAHVGHTGDFAKKRRVEIIRGPPCMIVDLFNDFRDGSKLLDLLEVMSQRMSRERGRGMFQHRSNIEKALLFLKMKSIKLVNINIPDIIDGKPSIILGLIWTIILQYHIEELASSLSFNSRQPSMESLASLDSHSTLSSRSASSSPVPLRGSPLHRRFRVSAKKALLLWVREQCHKAGCSINVKDFKASWRSGVVFLAIQYALRPDLVDLSKARTRSNKQNLEEAFRIAEKELKIPRLLDPDDVDVRDPDEKSIMTYVAQFLQYSKDLPAAEEEMQTQYLNLPKSPSPVNLPVHYTPAISASPLRQVQLKSSFNDSFLSMFPGND